MSLIDDYLAAAIVPWIPDQKFGLWKIYHLMHQGKVICTFLAHQVPVTEANLHLVDNDGIAWDTVMEDSPKELSRHLPIWLNARGNVLVTGLGLGCVVRGLLCNPEVTHIDCVEIDADIIRVIGKEFERDRIEGRLAIHHGDALTINLAGGRWDFAWHDLWTGGEPHISVLHMRLLNRFRDCVGRQGAWGLPQWTKRKLASYYPVLGGPTTKRYARMAQ